LNKVLIIEGDEVWTSSRLGILRNGKVLVKDGRIADVGKDVEVPVGAEVIHGSVVTPGLIDAHTH
jgi:imidazolonepropionase-like amidohydrolase